MAISVPSAVTAAILSILNPDYTISISPGATQYKFYKDIKKHQNSIIIKNPLIPTIVPGITIRVKLD